jgi:hypothetical protein
MRAQLVEDERALLECLAHQSELQLLEVAQPAVDQLAGPAGGARCVVACLDQRHGKPPGRCVERHTGADHPRADHEHVELLGGQPAQGIRALERAETAAAGIRGRQAHL